MKPTIYIQDDFFPEPEIIRNVLIEGRYQDFISEVDGVTYPGINLEVPRTLTRALGKQLATLFRQELQPTVQPFARLTTGTMPAAPHRIHTDALMGQYAALVYMSKPPTPVQFGTSFWSHLETSSDKFTPETDPGMIDRDSNDERRWDFLFRVPGLFNRLLVYDARLYHCADPVGGWGASPGTGRLVLTSFFNLAGK